MKYFKTKIGKIVEFISNKLKQLDPILFPEGINNDEKELILYIKRQNLSATGYERLSLTVLATKHVEKFCIEGAFVECGVWRGGNSLLAASMFKKFQSLREIYLFDTFEGMAEISEFDLETYSRTSARDRFLKEKGLWNFATLEDVKENFQNLDLLNEKVKFIKGPVEETLEIPQNIPEKISILRLDTDLYSSTKKELECLYPRLSRSGIMMIDDYGYWEGATKAVKEYFAENALTPFLMPISHTGVVLVKQ